VDLIHYPDDACPLHWRTPVLALGNFDGLHRGHMTIVARVRQEAEDSGATSVVLTFDPHPTRITRPDRAPQLLMTLAQKREVLERSGVAGLAVVRFTPEVAHWTPDEFVARVLVDWLHVSAVWVGAAFLFGHDRTGDVGRLRELGQRWGFRAEKIDSVRLGDVVVSSTAIRQLVLAGAVDQASALLGRPYAIDGRVVPGDGRGRTIGFPTANLALFNELLPAGGVYATIAGVRGQVYPAVTNIGTRPTFGAGREPSVETHLLTPCGDVYCEVLRLHFITRLRDERAFESAGDLAAQIRQDGERARALLEGISV